MLNGYPLLFSDTGALLAQTVEGWAAWDKPFVYGPLLQFFHWRWSLWPAAVAQALLLSWLIWLTQRAWLGTAHARTHLLILAVLAAGTSAPWIASLLLPDALTPALVLALALLGFTDDRLGMAERVALAVLATLATASHLSHLPLGVALVVLVALSRWAWRPVLLVATPLLAAAILLVASNAVVQGRAAISPYGSVFLLARLAADGPAARTVAAACATSPPPAWRLCAWVGRMPADSDEFLWRGDGPVWGHPGGPTGLAPEASAIIAATLARDPVAVLQGLVMNATAQAGRFRVGDTLVPDHLDVTVGRQLRLGFPPAEYARFATGLQASGQLRAAADPYLWPQVPIIVLSCIGLAVAVAATRDRQRAGFLLAVPLALLMNAAVTGGLSKPHDRYQARLIWLLPLAALGALPASARPLARPRGGADATQSARPVAHRLT